MDIGSAKAKLDHVIGIGRVEMYKPIQVAEVLHVARKLGGLDLSDVERYRTKSRHWRDEVTLELFGKRSTSSARFQDDVWNESAVPPAAMVALGRANAENGLVESYIYSFIVEKNQELFAARSIIADLSDFRDLSKLLVNFEAPGLTSSADRLYEIVAASVFKAELGQTRYMISIDRHGGSDSDKSVELLVDLVSDGPMPLVVDRLGHTNAADAGLDIWTNFGVAINVKRRVLTVQLLDQVVSDTPIGLLHIVCLEVDPSVKTRLNELRRAGRKITISTQDKLLRSVDRLLSEENASKTFVKTLNESFDREFPMARTLGDFIERRGYDPAELSGIWKRAL
jgi:type II restriction enzyme